MKTELSVRFWTKFFYTVFYKGLLGKVNYLYMEGMLIRTNGMFAIEFSINQEKTAGRILSLNYVM